MKVWQQSRWYCDLTKDCWCLTKAGAYEAGERCDVELEIHREDIQKLIVALDEQGWIKPRLDERLRAEDLKITHRLLDIIQQKLK